MDSGSLIQVTIVTSWSKDEYDAVFSSSATDENLKETLSIAREAPTERSPILYRKTKDSNGMNNYREQQNINFLHYHLKLECDHFIRKDIRSLHQVKLETTTPTTTDQEARVFLCKPEQVIKEMYFYI